MAGLDDLLNGIWGTVTDALPGGTGTSGGSVIPTTPAPTSSGPNPYNPLGEYPDLGLIPQLPYSQVQSILDGLARTRHVWATRASAAKSQGGSGGGPTLDHDEIENKFYIGGVPVTSREYYDEEERQKKLSGDDSKKSPELAMAEQALADIDSYIKTVTSTAVEKPKDPKELAPVKLTIDQLMQALGGQESSVAPPSWASATRTQGFGPANNTLDGPYTDDNGVYHEHFNKGYDFGLAAGTKVESTVPGTVIAAGNQGDGWGNSVKIRDAQGNVHNYGHLGEIFVSVGDNLGSASTIGKVGAPGAAGEKSDGSHLSYDVMNANGRFLDPAPFVRGINLGASNPSGARGTFQILDSNWPSWVVEAGLPAGTPRTAESEYAVTKYKLGQYLAQAGGDPVKAVAAWYRGPVALTWAADDPQWDTPQIGKDGVAYPSVREYATQVLGRLGDTAKNIVAGTQTPNGLSVTFDSSGKPVGAGGTASADPLYWQKAAAGESDRRYDNWSQRQKDYMTAAGADNDLLKDLASILGNKVSAEKANQDIQDSAIETAMGVNAAVKAGKADYYDSMGGGIWGNSLGGIIKELDNIYNQMNRPVPGMTDTMLSTIPRYAPQDYYMDIPGLPDEPTEFFTPNRYATGTVDWHDEPYIAIAQSGGNIPLAVRKRLEAAGALGPSATPTTPTTGGTPPVATPTVTGGYPGAGYVPRNSTLPTPERVYDTNEWLDQAVSSMARNISAGNSGLPAEWGVTGLEAWHGVPPSQMDASFLTRLRSIILAHKSDPAIVQAFGADPGIATEYVRDPNAPAAPKTTTTGNGGMMNGYGSSQTMSGTYGGGMDPTDAARIGLEKESLDLQREIQRAQMELERQKFELAKIQDTRSAEYTEKEYQLRVTEQALAAQRFELEKTNADLQKTIFEDNVRRWEIETGMSRERLDLDKIAQEAELDFKRQQLDIQRDAGILDQKKYDESVRQFNETFGYQKAQDDRKFRLERAKTVAEFMADPNDPMARNFFYANMEDPKGIAFDMFTGENMGESTYGETYKKNAEMWEESTQPVNQFSSGSMYSHGSPYVRDSLFITGDHVSGRATGNEEAIYNPTGAPVAIFSNEMTRALGLAPKKGKNFRGAA